MNSTHQPPFDDSNIPDGYQPTDTPGVYEYNPNGYVRTPEQEALVQEDMKNVAALNAARQAAVESSQQHCPICGNKVVEDTRYPDYVCKNCEARATDTAGRKVNLYNQSMSGGFKAQYEDGTPAPEVDTSHTVYINGKPFHADEAHFGGIVIRPL